LAEFIVGNSLRKLARKHNFLRQLLWRVDYVLIWSLVKIARLLPVDTASRLGARVGAWVGPKMSRKTNIYKENMRQAFPEISEPELQQRVNSAWARAGRIMMEYPHLDTILREPERLQIDIRQPIATYTDPSRPCVIVTAHLSNWEVVCSAMARLGMPNASLYSPPTNPLLDKLLMDSRRALNCELLPRDNSARLLMRAMKQGRTAAMVMDRRVDDGSPIRFFGRDKISTLMPARLAMKFDCELVPVQVERLKNAHYRVIFHPPVVTTVHSGDDNERAIDMIQQVHNQFEDWIRAQPDDWFCSKRLWPKSKTDPSKEAGTHADVDSYAA
jgi:KDO2-lipid IV(A) lauroyltransferase